MPGLVTNLSPSAVTYAQELRVAFQLSSSLQQIGAAISGMGQYQLSHATMRDPTYIVKEGDKIRRFWQTEEDRKRIAKYHRYDKMLHDGSDFLKAEWYRGREWADYENQSVHQPYNLCPLISAALTDLTVGGGCRINTGIPEVDTLLNEDMQISSAVYQWLFEASVYGFVGVQVVANVDAGEMQLNRILPHNLYLQRSSNQDREPVCISKKIWMPLEEIPDWKNIPPEDILWGSGITGSNADGFVFEERHFKGVVEYYLWVVKGPEITARIPLRYFRDDLIDAQLTGLSDFAITILPNEQVIGRHKGDWDDLADINRNFNDRASRVNELLNKYEAPNLMVGETQATLDPVTGKTYFRTPRQGVILVRPQDKFEPKYLQPSVATSGSENNLMFLLKMLAMHAQVSPALLDPDKMDGIQSGVAYKLRLTPTLAKVNRRRVGQQESVKRLVFNVVSTMNMYYHKTLVRDHLRQGAEERVKDAFTKRAMACSGALNRLGESGATISLDAFDEVFEAIEVLHNQPKGIFLQDPRTASNPEELQWLADQGLLDYIATKEAEMFELLMLKEIHVEFVPALPQDEAQALTRLGDQPSMSLHRFLQEYDDLTEEQAAEESARIREEQQTSFGGMGFGGLGVEVGGQPVPDALNTQSDAIQAGTQPSVVNSAVE